MNDDECIHDGIECEHNTGPDACPCRCAECAEWEDETDGAWQEPAGRSVSLTLGTPREPQVAKTAPRRPLGLVQGSGRAGESRRLDRVVSLRFDVPTHAAVSELAEAEGVTASEWIRRAVASIVFESQRPQEPAGLRAVGSSCEHMNLTSLPGVLGNVTAWCGCEMQPVYKIALAGGDP